MSQGRPVGVLSSSIDISEAEATAGKQAFLKAMQDSSVAMLYNVDFKPVQWNANDLALVPTREYNLRLASDITGVSPYLLGVPSESRVYSNMETEWANFIKVTLGKYINSIEQVLSTCFPRDKTVRFYIDELLRGDSSQRWATYEKAINLGVMTAAEVRELEGRGVAEDLEEPPPPEPTAEADPAQPEDGDENA
jgi:HK97 family phage portal protein